ncbi:hypothetical protein Tco_0680098 [Tanacetum coccineum]|uniref:FBD domain-containing protein n=1 Tax=Tanacetum coccineum TaxID=301880 RepID=A0ABQ4XJV9_9ASTR
MDRISNLPSTVIETILCLVAIQEAARTSIPSKEWRYHWISIPKLVFNEGTFEVSTSDIDLSILEQTFDIQSQRKGMTRRCKLFYAIYQVLLKHMGPIHEFSLKIRADKTCVEIDHIIFHLVRNNSVKKFSLDTHRDFKLPLSFLSLHHLTELYLNMCTIVHQPPFTGFGSLTSLHMELISISEDTLLHLLSKSPLLKNVTLIDIEWMENIGISNSTITNFFELLPVVENLSIYPWTVTRFLRDGVPLKLPTALVRLKYLYVGHTCFNLKCRVALLALLMRSSPNLKKLKIQIDESSGPEPETSSFTLRDFSEIWLEHLNEFEIIDVSNVKDELDFITLILAKSPLLKKANIFLWEDINKKDDLQISRILLASPQASPMLGLIMAM